MSSEPNLEKKEEIEKATDINIDKEEIQNTEINFNLNGDLENAKPNNQNKKNNITNSNKNIDVSTSNLVLKNNENPEKNILNKLNERNSNNNGIKENSLNQSFMQRTKSWMSNIWTNVKNYDYGKYNIFKKPEMEDCIDAHGNHIKIPKNSSKKEIYRKKENNEDFKKYNNLDYNRYYFTDSNINIFSGYPF